MKVAITILLILVVLVVIVCVYFTYLSINEKTPKTGLVDGTLRPCPSTPNCVSSEATGEHFINPLHPNENSDLNEQWQKAIETLTQMGGTVQHQDAEYIWATFKSQLFKFTDDVELRRDDANGVIQIRSGSRAGNSDFGVNRKRVEELRSLLAEKQL